jgi:hypothetical protein
VKHSWLKPFAAGAATVTTATVGAWLIASYSAPEKSIIVKYLKPEGPEPGDPAPQSSTAAMYVAYIAGQCGIKSWELSAPFAMHEPEPGILIVPFDDSADQHINCLAKFVKSPFVTLEIKHNNAQTH